MDGDGDGVGRDSSLFSCRVLRFLGGDWEVGSNSLFSCTLHLDVTGGGGEGGDVGDRDTISTSLPAETGRIKLDMACLVARNRAARSNSPKMGVGGGMVDFSTACSPLFMPGWGATMSTSTVSPK